MDIIPAELPFLSNIGFMLTYKCPIACPHCIVEAGPHRKEEICLEHCLTWIEQASTYRGGHIKGLALTGGEPFYNLEALAQISAYGQALGFIVSVVTNAFWATTRPEALSVLSKLPAVRMLSISTDVYHQKAIPFDHIKNAVWAAKELGRPYNIAVCTDNEKDQQYQKIIEELKVIGEADRIRPSITFPVGRAQKRARHFSYRTAPEPTVAACTMAGSPVVFPDGKVTGCIGPVLTLPPTHPLFLGNLRQESLSEILDRAELNPVLHTIRVWGPHKLVSLLRQNGFDELIPKEYICNCICDVCYKLLSDERIVDALESILQDTRMKQTIAYARLYYLNETTMAELYHLHATDHPDCRKSESHSSPASTSAFL
jgi:MoaA/NifB/PqqE/SkfB family radical SAM enzyme